MPAEWHRHDATWLVWPHVTAAWDEGLLGDVESSYVDMIRALVPGEAVRLLVADEAMERRAALRIRSGGVSPDRVVFHRIPTMDSWIRDYGPTFVIRPGADKPVGMVHWRFNAWGNKYPDVVRDGGVPRVIADALRIPRFEPGIVLEGGSIEVNGAGDVLVTEQCLLHANRNPALSRIDIEGVLRDSLGVRNVLWLGEGVAGDDTDGHVDDVARFVNPTTVVCAVEENPADENHKPLRENFRRLRAMRGGEGRPLEVVPLPTPGRVELGGRRLPASYANFFIANAAVLVPFFGHPNDDKALGILKRFFPDRRVTGIPARAMVAGNGSVHCLSQQQPAAG
ncbi:MAG: agmatine deiminase family protein [Planctomycetota bacterium]